MKRMTLRSLQLVRKASTGARNERRTSFGFRPVTEEEKAAQVQEVFSSVASNYDVMNDVMSLGLHRLWKDWFVHQLALPPGTRVLDVAGGTGDIAYRLLDYRPVDGERSGCEVTVLDANPHMLQEGKKRRKDSREMLWVLGDALALPFPSNSFEAYTIVFGIRNVSSIRQALAEARRVLVPGGRFACMEFSHLPSTILQRLYDIYSFQFIPVFGELIAQDRLAYKYLVESIRQFPAPDVFADMIADEGLSSIYWEPLCYGVVAFHSAFKLTS